jgi:signal transduction histidine kinase
MFSSAIGVWALTLYVVTTTKNEVLAIRWQYLLDICATFIPVFYYSFVNAFLRRDDRVVLRILYGLTVLITFFSFTPAFKIGVTNTLGFFWINPGRFYILFALYFIATVGYSIFLLNVAFISKNTVNAKYRSQIKYQLLAGIVGFSGSATTFFPQLFNIFPFGNYFTSFYILLISYSIYKHGLFNIKVLTTELFISFILIVQIIDLFLSGSLAILIPRFFIMLATALLGTLLTKNVMKEVESRKKNEQLARYLANANARLRELDRQKTEFVSIASHQLRAPVAAIRGYTSLIVDGTFGAVPEPLTEPLGRISESGGRLALMIDDFLNVSRIEQGKMSYHMERINLGALVDTIYEEQRLSAEKKGLVCTYIRQKDPVVWVMGDAGKLKQILSNLIDNAIKYTPKGTVTIELERLDTHRSAMVAIKDSGIGIAEADMDQLFQKFKRATNANEANVYGTGLGLYIAKEIIRAHNGWIHVASAGVGKGSTFTVELPYAPDVAEE